jgi:hypothetical protein
MQEFARDAGRSAGTYSMRGGTMKVTVTKQDIVFGIENIMCVCGCPIWLSLRRKLGIRDGDDLKFLNYHTVRVGKRAKIVINLPRKAVEWQKRAAKHPDCAKPISFDAALREGRNNESLPHV